MKKLVNKTREDAICEILNSSNAKTGVEIGVFKGEFSKRILQGWNGRMYLIDPWRPLGEEYLDSSNHNHHLDAYSKTAESIKGFEDRAFMLRGLSSQLVDLFQDESLDWVYIDGNHAYDYVKQDLKMWWPKLKPGGLMSGHDFLQLDWNSSYTFNNGKDKHVYADGTKWWIKAVPGRHEDGYAGIFGVNPAVEEFCQERDLDFQITQEWTSSFLIKK
jgi:hypothetical protein